MTLPKLNPNTPTLMDGEVRLFKRKHSSVWQVVFMMDGRQVRVSTKKRILKDAKDAAREIYMIIASPKERLACYLQTVC